MSRFVPLPLCAPPADSIVWSIEIPPPMESAAQASPVLVPLDPPTVPPPAAPMPIVESLLVGLAITFAGVAFSRWWFP